MSLFHINLIAMSISCILLLVGYSTNRSKLGGLAMGLGLIGILGLIAANILVMVNGG